MAPALSEAERRWVASGLATAQAVTALGAIQVQVADLHCLTLGLANQAQEEIIIDANAAGYGWFIDPTLSQNQEFARPLSSDESAATPGSAAAGRMDLLTVVEHELGHLLGFEHNTIDVMDETLTAGMRITPMAVASPSPDAGGMQLPAYVIDWGSAAASGTGKSASLATVRGNACIGNFVTQVGANGRRPVAGQPEREDPDHAAGTPRRRVAVASPGTSRAGRAPIRLGGYADAPAHDVKRPLAGASLTPPFTGGSRNRHRSSGGGNPSRQVRGVARLSTKINKFPPIFHRLSLVYR